MKGERVNPELMKELIKVLGVSRRRVNQLIQEEMQLHKYLYSRRIIALDLAAQYGINIQQYALPDELVELRKLHQSTIEEVDELYTLADGDTSLGIYSDFIDS